MGLDRRVTIVIIRESKLRFSTLSDAKEILERIVSNVGQSIKPLQNKQLKIDVLTNFI